MVMQATVPIRICKTRTVFDIMSDVLEVAKERQRKTRIMCSCYLSFKELNRYLALLLDLGLLERQSSEYQTTAKGLAYLKKYKELTSILFSIWVNVVG